MKITNLNIRTLCAFIAVILVTSAGCSKKPSDIFLNSKVALSLINGKSMDLTITPLGLYTDLFKNDPAKPNREWKSEKGEWILHIEAKDSSFEIHFIERDGKPIASYAVIAGQKIDGDKFLGMMVGIADKITFGTTSLPSSQDSE